MISSLYILFYSQFIYDSFHIHHFSRLFYFVKYISICKGIKSTQLNFVLSTSGIHTNVTPGCDKNNLVEYVVILLEFNFASRFFTFPYCTLYSHIKHGAISFGNVPHHKNLDLLFLFFCFPLKCIIKMVRSLP